MFVWALPTLLLLAAPARAERVDLNRASAEVLAALPVLGPTKATALVHWLTTHGPCRELDELTDVPGIGAATVAALRERAYCGSGQRSEDEAPSNAAFPATTMPELIDINHASLEELQRLPGLIEPRARALVEYREANGPFASCEELSRVPSIGPATVANLGSACVAR